MRGDVELLKSVIPTRADHRKDDDPRSGGTCCLQHDRMWNITSTDIRPFLGDVPDTKRGRPICPELSPHVTSKLFPVPADQRSRRREKRGQNRLCTLASQAQLA
jgi:hypothetical protein